MDSETQIDQTRNRPISEDKMLQSNWEEISTTQRETLLKKYGEPITIPNVKFEISESQRNGTCDANEKSIGAMEEDRMYWGYYNLNLINNEIIQYDLAITPRILTNKIIKGENGGYILPGWIYTEDKGFNNEPTLGETALTQGTWHEINEPGQRGSFRTVHLSTNQPTTFRLTPIRSLGGEVSINGKRKYVNSKSIHSIAKEAAYHAVLDEDKQYSRLYEDLPAYFENPDLVKTIKTRKLIVRDHEINLPVKEVVKNDPKRKSVVIQPRQNLQAIIDPVSFNNHGEEVYIINFEGKYYFCPKKDIE